MHFNRVIINLHKNILNHLTDHYAITLPLTQVEHLTE